MTRKCYAHSANRDGGWHLLINHLRATADAAAKYASHFGLAEHARLAGLWHDAGKFSAEFQRYLHDAAESSGKPLHRIPHSPLGAIVLARQGTASLAALPVAGHHAGLPSKAEFVGTYLLKYAPAQSPMIERTWPVAISELEPHTPDTKALSKELSQLAGLNEHDTELLIRMLFSALVDADWLDTERHFNPQMAAARRSVRPDTAVLYEHFSTYMDGVRADAADSKVNRIRAEVLDCCLAAAEQELGVFRLTVPTGGGKTLASLGFALSHAVKHELNRVIYAIPYTSIIEQTASVFRSVFKGLGEPCPVIEHHSALNLVSDAGSDAADDDNRERQRLASENWDAPLIVTTTVQLFDSLFSNRPATCRKLHNLANSVIILDEVQTLPVELLEPVISVLQALVRNCRATIVLCTATQPALSHERWGFSPPTREIVPQYREHFEQLTRVDYEHPSEPWSWERLADEVAGCEQCLVVLNTKAHAIKVMRALRARNAAGESGILHLSTRLTGAHRRLVLADVRQRLEDRLPCRLISTQVVEAGVDLDFPVVMRAVGPLDRIVQVAGRCNREGVLGHGRALGRVVVFSPEDKGVPRGTYRTASAQAQSLLSRARVDLNDPATYERYFKLLYQVVDCDQRKIQPLREAFNYPEVAQRGHLIDSDTIAVVVPDAPGGVSADDEELDKLLSRIQAQATASYGINSQDWRRLQAHVINLWPYEAAKHVGELEEIAPGVTVWRGGYDELEGIRLDGPAVEDLIVDTDSA